MEKITKEELSGVMKDNYDDLINFVTTTEFREVFSELMNLTPHDRPKFVVDVFLDKEKLESKGVTVPEGILIQRSTFGDRRPTLFCVKKWLPKKYHHLWENVNITFDNPYDDEDVPRNEKAWRKPLPTEVQYGLMTGLLIDSD